MLASGAGAPASAASALSFGGAADSGSSDPQPDTKIADSRMHVRVRFTDRRVAGAPLCVL
jgi:hypothetical protein